MSDTIHLRTGRDFYANCRIVGIDEDLNIFGGYDDGVRGAGLDDTLVPNREKWTVEDRVALAELMIARWSAYRDQALGEHRQTD